MKKIILLLAIAGMITQAHAQVKAEKIKATNAPVAVTTAFNQAHSSVKDVKWTLKDGNNYEAAYKDGKVNSFATYDSSGNFIEKKVEITNAAMPAPALSYVKQNYKEDRVDKAFKVTDASGTVTYRAKVKDMHLTFDSNGTFIKAVKK